MLHSCFIILFIVQMENTVRRSFAKGTTTSNSMKRLSNILAEHKVSQPDETGILPEDEKYARYDSAFNPKALSSRKDDDESYEGEEPGMSNDVTVCEADNVIANTGINPIMFEEWIDTEAWMNVLRLHEQANGLKVPEVSQTEMDKRDEVESDKKENPHYCLMDVIDHVKRLDNNEDTDRRTPNKRRFYWNWTEWYETCDDNIDYDWYTEDQEEFKNQEKQEHKRKQKVAVQLLYRKLKESKAWMKQAYNNKKYMLAQEFRKEYEYCSKWLDKLKECDEKIKQAAIKRRKNKLFDNYITLCNLGCPMTVEQLKKIINEKSLWYAEKVVASKISEWKLKNDN